MTPPKNYLIDMDGVLVTGRTLVPGADGFLDRLRGRGAEYLELANNPLDTPGDLALHLRTIDLDAPQERAYTSAKPTALLLKPQEVGRHRDR